MKALGIAAVMMLLSAAEAQVQPQQWVLMEVNDRHLTALDRTSVTPAADALSAKYIIVNRHTDARDSDYAIHTIEVYCERETFQLKSYVLFKLSGEVIREHFADTVPISVDPRSRADLLFQHLCNGLDLGNPISRTPLEFATGVRLYLIERTP